MANRNMFFSFNMRLFILQMYSVKIECDLTNEPRSKLLELLDTHICGSVQWVLLEISWIYIEFMLK